jgi:glycosyltransferase involved in cell wall biosynthesis
VRDVVFAAPGDLATATGGYVYDRRVVLGLRALGWRTEAFSLGEGFPFPNGAARAAARRQLTALPAGQLMVIDGLALGALPELAAEICTSHRLIALVHHPLALENGLSPTDAEAFRVSERRALACARRVVVTSAFTSRLMVSDYGVQLDRVAIVKPGTDRATRARVNNTGAPVELLAVGAVTPRKGYDILLAACALVLDLPWRLTIVGDLGRDSDAAARLEVDVARLNLCDRVLVTGTIPADRLASLYANADLFVLASHFEGYGMAFAEAIAHGLPVIGTTAGAIPETVPPNAGVLTPPGDIRAFSVALRRLIEDTHERRRLAAVAWASANTLSTWEQAAEQFSHVIETVA